jgi:hypothetical protein
MQAKAAWKRSCRDLSNLAAAKAILRDGDDTAAAGQLPAAPQFPAFRAAGTLGELAVLMQQAAAELPFYE